MKMDAAVPFNIPVDPIALRLPVSVTFYLCIVLLFFSSDNMTW